MVGRSQRTRAALTPFRATIRLATSPGSIQKIFCSFTPDAAKISSSCKKRAPSIWVWFRYTKKLKSDEAKTIRPIRSASTVAASKRQPTDRHGIRCKIPVEEASAARCARCLRSARVRAVRVRLAWLLSVLRPILRATSVTRFLAPGLRLIACGMLTANSKSRERRLRRFRPLFRRLLVCESPTRLIRTRLLPFRNLILGQRPALVCVTLQRQLDEPID